MTSSMRPSNQMSPSLSRLAPSPAKYLPREPTPQYVSLKPLGVAVDAAGHAGPRCRDDQVARPRRCRPIYLALSTMSALIPGTAGHRRARAWSR